MAKVVIVSAPRTGSSMLTSVFFHSGFYVGDFKQGDEHNKLGYFENKAINTILSLLLSAKDNEDEGRKFSPVGLKLNSQDVLNHNMIASSVFYNQENIICKNIKYALLPDLLEFYDKVIVLTRDRGDTIKSFLKAPFMSHFKDENEINNYLDNFDACLSQISGDNVLKITYENLLNGDDRIKLNRFIGKELNYGSVIY